jgi:hypothetical protein
MTDEEEVPMPTIRLDVASMNALGLDPDRWERISHVGLAGDHGQRDEWIVPRSVFEACQAVMA